MTTKTLLVRSSLLAFGLAFAVAASHALASAHGAASERAASPATGDRAAVHTTAGARPDLSAPGALASEDPLEIEAREARASAHAADLLRRNAVRAKLLADPLTRPLGELMGKYMDVERAKLDATPEDIAAFKALFADPVAGAAFATRALELLPREGFGFERSAVLAGLASLGERGQEAKVVPVMMDELAHTVIAAPAPDALGDGTLDLGLPQIAQRSLLGAHTVSDEAAVEATAHAMMANGHVTVTMALARQLAALRPGAKDMLVAALERDGFPVESIVWTEGDVQ